MDHIKISVIIPVYNAEDGIKKCLESIVNQSLKGIEIICIDDASTDSSAKIIKELSRKYEQIKYFKLPENSGAGIARNNGLEHANGEYISFIDADDFVIDNSAYEQLYNAANENNADTISANIRHYDGKFHKSVFACEIGSNSPLLPEDYGMPWFFGRNIYKKQFLEKNNIKFPNYRRGEDPVFMAKVLKNVDIIHCLPIDFYAYTYTYQTTPYKVTDKDSELGHIQYYKAVFEILNEPRFTNARLESEKTMYEFCIYHKYSFLSKSIDDTMESVFGKDSKILINYKLKCLEHENKLLRDQLNKTKRQLTEYLTTTGYLKYKSKNIVTRLGNKFKINRNRKNVSSE